MRRVIVGISAGLVGWMSVVMALGKPDLPPETVFSETTPVESPILSDPVKIGEAFQRGLEYYQRREFEQALPWLAQAAKADHVQAQGLLGSMYLVGQGSAKDVLMGLHWLTQAAQRGHLEAQSLLGAVYLVGQDVPPDVTKAVRWLNSAANSGLADAQYVLGTLYVQGKGVPQNVKSAIHWLSAAATQGHRPAQELLKQLIPPAHPISAPTELPKIPGKYRLWINSDLLNSRVKILNIKPVYESGMALKPGKYEVEVSAAGYVSRRFWVELKNQDVTVAVRLEKR